MKNYAEYPYASVSMSTDDHFVKHLAKLFAENNIINIIESGTYIGTGSTTSLANAIIHSGKQFPNFHTLEVDRNNYILAKKNLSKFKFIKPVWALSVSKNEAIDFIKNDEAIINHEEYPDVFIDRLDNPQQFYLDEVEGQLFKNEVKTSRLRRFLESVGLISEKETLIENYFSENIPKIKTTNPLFLLDSAGGLGYLEYKTMHQLMDGYSYFLILDDIHHLKHFRSYQNVSNDSNYEILGHNIENGWLIAKYKGK